MCENNDCPMNGTCRNRVTQARKGRCDGRHSNKLSATQTPPTAEPKNITMKPTIDTRLHWTDHYAKHGFAVVKNILEPAYIEEALNEVKKLVKSDLPMDQWTKDNTPKLGTQAHNEVFRKVYDQPKVRAAIDEMFGSPHCFLDERAFQLFFKPRDPQAKPELLKGGHIDFVDVPIPVFGNGFMIQFSLVNKQPFGGNITIWPGTHKVVQKHIMDDPNWRYPANWGGITNSEPYEFVAGAGDALFFHHLVAHEGNVCTTAMPRISLHCQVLRKEWLKEISADHDLSPWERSLAMNGPYKVRCDEQKMMEEGYRRRKAKTPDHPQVKQKEELAAVDAKMRSGY